MYKYISRRQDQNCILMNNEVMLSHEGNQGGSLSHFDNMIADRQEEEFVVASRRRLDCKYSQEENEYNHPNAMLIQWNE